MRPILRMMLCIAIPLAIGACASVPQQPARLGLRLAPAALGTSISLQQHLRVQRGERIDYLDAALEVDAAQVSMIGLALGQRVLSLRFDGTTMESWRHALLPAQVRGEDVLEDIQLTYWPVEAIRAALPAGWSIEDAGRRRTLSSDGVPVTVIDYSAEPRWGGQVILSNLRYQYQLTIQSVPTNQ